MLTRRALVGLSALAALCAAARSAGAQPAPADEGAGPPARGAEGRPANPPAGGGRDRGDGAGSSANDRPGHRPAGRQNRRQREEAAAADGS